MIPTVAEVTARWRAALVVALLGIASVLTAVSLAPAMSAEYVVVVTALAAARALVGRHVLVVVPGSGPHALRAPGRADGVPLVLAGRTTDAVHHLLRPRAPGLV